MLTRCVAADIREIGFLSIPSAARARAVAMLSLRAADEPTCDLVDWIGIRKGMLDVESGVGVDEFDRLDLAVTVAVDGDWIDEAAHGTLLRLSMMTYVSK